VRLHLGDSATILPQIAASLDRPTLFWLDAHYSGGATGGAEGHPLMDELHASLRAEAGHVVLIDDLREFGVATGYPTLEEARSAAAEHGYTFETQHDIARLVPR